MQLNIKAPAVTLAVLWGGTVCLAGMVQQVVPDYGTAFLATIASIYPGTGGGGWAVVGLGTAFAVADGALTGALFAWLYNRVAGLA